MEAEVCKQKHTSPIDDKDSFQIFLFLDDLKWFYSLYILYTVYHFDSIYKLLATHLLAKTAVPIWWAKYPEFFFWDGILFIANSLNIPFDSIYVFYYKKLLKKLFSM